MSRIWPISWMEAHGKGLTVAVTALAALAYLAFIQRYGVNVPFKDEWAVVSLDRLLVHGQLTLSALWAQHNENRMLFPNLLMLGLDHFSHLNTKVEMDGSAVLLLAAVALTGLVFWRTAGLSLLWFAPAALLVLSWAQYAVTLQGFAIALYLVLACLAVALLALVGAEARAGLFALAIAAAVIASYSSTQGLAVWVAGLVLMVARGQSRGRVWAWLGAGVVTSAIYWIGFQWSATGGGVRWAVAHPGASLKFMLVLAGGTISPSHALGIGTTAQAVVGAILLLVGLAAFAYWLRRRPTGMWLSLPLALVAFGVLVDLLITLGRAHYGIQEATSPRYTVFNLWLFAGVWLAGAAVCLRSPRRAAGPTLTVLALLCAVQILGAYHAGLIDGRATYNLRQEEVPLILNYRTAPPAEVAKLVDSPYSGFQQLSAFLAHQRLSIFHPPSG